MALVIKKHNKNSSLTESFVNGSKRVKQKSSQYELAKLGLSDNHDIEEDRLWPRHGWVRVTRWPMIWNPETKRKEPKMRSSMRHVSHVQAILDENRGRDDVFITQQVFRTKVSSKGENLLGYTGFVLDFDIVKANGLTYDAFDPHAWMQRIFAFLDENDIPLPTNVVASGGGLHTKWWFPELVGPGAKKLIDAIYDRVFKLFEDERPEFGIDTQVRDSSRILRLPGTKHRKSKKRVEIIYRGERVAVDDLRNGVFWYSKEQIQEWRRKYGPANGRKKAKVYNFAAEKSKRSGRVIMGEAPDWADYNRRRVDDLVHIAQGLWPQGVDEGHRDLFGFLIAVHLAHITPVDGLEQVIRDQLSVILPSSFVEDEMIGFCSALFERARSDDPDKIYTYSTKRIMGLLPAIPADVAKDLKVLVPADEKRRRKNEPRRKTGLARDEWLEVNSTSAEAPWAAEGVSRATWYRRKKAEKAQETEQTVVEEPQKPALYVVGETGVSGTYSSSVYPDAEGIEMPRSRRPACPDPLQTALPPKKSLDEAGTAAELFDLMQYHEPEPDTGWSEGLIDIDDLLADGVEADVLRDLVVHLVSRGRFEDRQAA